MPKRGRLKFLSFCIGTAFSSGLQICPACGVLELSWLFSCNTLLGWFHSLQHSFLESPCLRHLQHLKVSSAFWASPLLFPTAASWSFRAGAPCCTFYLMTFLNFAGSVYSPFTPVSLLTLGPCCLLMPDSAACVSWCSLSPQSIHFAFLFAPISLFSL